MMRLLLVLTMITGIAGAVCLGIAAQSKTYVDETGRLVEPFAWMASGRILLVLFAVGAIMSISVILVRSRRRHLHLGRNR